MRWLISQYPKWEVRWAGWTKIVLRTAHSCECDTWSGAMYTVEVVAERGKAIRGEDFERAFRFCRRLSMHQVLLFSLPPPQLHHKSCWRVGLPAQCRYCKPASLCIYHGGNLRILLGCHLPSNASTMTSDKHTLTPDAHIAFFPTATSLTCWSSHLRSRRLILRE